jgi:hypothetical protein
MRDLGDSCDVATWRAQYLEAARPLNSCARWCRPMSTFGTNRGNDVSWLNPGTTLTKVGDETVSWESRTKTRHASIYMGIGRSYLDRGMNFRSGRNRGTNEMLEYLLTVAGIGPTGAGDCAAGDLPLIRMMSQSGLTTEGTGGSEENGPRMFTDLQEKPLPQRPRRKPRRTQRREVRLSLRVYSL